MLAKDAISKAPAVQASAIKDPTVQGSTAKGTAVQGSTAKGSSAQGGTGKGTAVQSSTATSPAVRGSAAEGHAVRDMTAPQAAAAAAKPSAAKGSSFSFHPKPRNRTQRNSTLLAGPDDNFADQEFNLKISGVTTGGAPKGGLGNSTGTGRGPVIEVISSSDSNGGSSGDGVSSGGKAAVVSASKADMGDISLLKP